MSWTERPWWAAASALAMMGLEVIVVDPAAEEDVILWDEVDEHGTVRVVAMAACGWSVSVHEPEARISG